VTTLLDIGSLREQLKFYDDMGIPLLSVLKHISPASYEEFIDALYTDLDALIGSLEADAKDFAEAGEDVLNRELVRLLNARYYCASHDNDEGGHVDIHVKAPLKGFSWLGEAKLDNGPAYILSGLNQLVTRYARGTPGNNAGGLLVYFQKDRCSDRFQEWRTELEQDHKDSFEDLEVADCSRRPGLAFESKFVLNRIGSLAPKYQVRHIAVSLFRAAVDDNTYEKQPKRAKRSRKKGS